MAMNGNAYKMIEIKKVSGPVVPLTSLNPLNPLTTLTDRYEPLPSTAPPHQQQQQRVYTDLSLNHNPAYNPHQGSGGPHNGVPAGYTALTQANSGYTPLSQPNGTNTLGRPGPPPPPSRDGNLPKFQHASQISASAQISSFCPNKSTVSREPGRQQQQERPEQAGQAARPAPGQLEQQQNTASPPPRPPEETNGVSLVNQQELDFNSKEEEKWWWVCCLEFCFCLL